MNSQDGTSPFTDGEGEIGTSRSSSVPQTLTIFSPTIVSTTFVPQTTGAASSTGSQGSQSTPTNANSDFNVYDNSAKENSSIQPSGEDRTTVIVLATVLSIVGFLAIAGTAWAVLRCRRRRSKLFSRGITPIGDDEIETWKGRRTEKGHDMDLGRRPRSPVSPVHERSEEKGHQKNESTTSIRKPPSVIVYARPSEEFSPISPTTPHLYSKMSFEGGKRSFENKDLPFTPIQARAPNAREGLTDETIPGDEPFVGSPKRRGSRLSKQAPRHGFQSHSRNKSSRSSSSLHRLGAGSYGYEPDDYRPSTEFYPGQSRVSESHEPPRLSLSDDWPAGTGGLSPRPFVRAEDIGRAIG